MNKLLAALALTILIALPAHAGCLQGLHAGEAGKAILHFPNYQNPAPDFLFSLSGLYAAIEFQRPDGTLVTHAATIEGSGNSCPDSFTPQGYAGGCDTYSLVAGDLPVPGPYTFAWCFCSSSPCTCDTTSPSFVTKTDECTVTVGPSLSSAGPSIRSRRLYRFR